MVDIESVMARLYEDEGLTTDLDDSEAQQLLKWAEAQVAQMAETQTDEAVFDEIFGVLRQFVKRVNRVVGQRAELAPEELSEQLSKLAENARALNAGELPAQALSASAQSLESTTPSALIDILTSWVAPRAPQSDNPTSLLHSPALPPTVDAPATIPSLDAPPSFPSLDAPPFSPMIAPPESHDLLGDGVPDDDSTDRPTEG